MIFKSKFHFWWVAISLCLATFLTRSPITSISTILPRVSEELHLNSIEQSIIIALPTLVMTIGSLFISRLDRKFGVVVSIFIGLVIILVGLIVRSYFSYIADLGVYFVYMGVMLSSVGLTIVMVLYPTFINAFFREQITSMSSINTTNIAISALAGTMTATLMVQHGFSWHAVGTVWVLVTIGVMLFYIPTFKFTHSRMKRLFVISHRIYNNTRPIDPNSDAHMNMWLQVPAWLFAICFGLQSANFYYALSWFPIIAHTFLTPAQVSMLLNSFLFVSAPFALISPIIIVKFSRHTLAFMVVTSIIYAISTVGMVFSRDMTTLFVSINVFGICTSLLISAYMVLIPLRTKTHIATSKLSGMVQAMAFLISTIFLLVFGLIKTFTGSYDLAKWVVTVYSVAMPILTILSIVIPFKNKLPKKLVQALQS